MHDLASHEDRAPSASTERGTTSKARPERATGATAAASAPSRSVAGTHATPPPGDELGRLLAAAVVRRACGERHRLVRPPARLGVARAVDQHADTHLPLADELAKIDVQINPTAPKAKGVAPPQWDGDVGQKDFAKKRAALKAQLTSALKKHLAGELKNLKALEAGPKLPTTAFEGSGRAAKRVVDDMFGSYTSAAALTKPQIHVRSTFAFTAGKQLLDRTNPADFTPDPADVARWIAQTDTVASAVQDAHHFNKDRSKTESDWLDKEVLLPFVTANKADLELYDVYGFASAGDTQVLITPTLTGSKKFPTTKPKGGGPSPAERLERWSMWELLVHEYIHTLEHPAFIAARGGNRILFEGFCEMFTEEVLRRWIPIAKKDTDVALREDVEGTDGAGKLWPGFTPELVAGYDAGSYADYAKRAKALRKVLGKGGENAVRAAFFQGHIELIGLASTGKVAAPPAGPGPPAGMRFHVVVASGRTVETADQIATQNGVSVADLKKANPAVDFAKLKAGDRVLIPVGP